nr:ABC transporter family substrate-binding protein [Williamsia sp. CHRR-6]
MRRTPSTRTGATRTRSRRAWVVAGALAAVTVLGACAADPPPPVRQSATPVPPTDVATGLKISVATDSIGVGLNPHLISDQSPMTAAVAALTLPSAFDPVQTPNGMAWVLDPAVLISAEVTSQEPFTVTYRITQDAQWSDGLPVTADDFAYLWQMMSKSDGVVAPAGYRLIDDVASRAGGKEAVVRFASPYPAWRELFSALLPSHILRGIPNGFRTAMSPGLPASGGQYTVIVNDTSRDEVRLLRNDRYWRTAAVIDKIVLHRVGTQSQLAESVRSGDTGVVALAGGPAIAGTLSAIPGVTLSRMPVARSLGITANVRSTAMADIRLREAVFGAINPQTIIDASAGDAVVTPSANTVLDPSDPGYFPVLRPRPDPARRAELFAAAGYRPEPAAVQPISAPSTTTASVPNPTGPSSAVGSSGSTASVPTTSTPSVEPGSEGTEATRLPTGVVPLQRAGSTLTLRIGVVAGDLRTRSAADSLADQLRAAGISTGVRVLRSDELYGPVLTDGGVDLVVGWRSSAISPATRLASSQNCDPRADDAGTPPSPTPAPSQASPTTPDVASSSVPAPGQSAVPRARFPATPAGLCDPRLAELAARAMTVADPLDLLRTAEPLVAAQFTDLPIYQDSILTAVGPGITGVRLQGPVASLIFGNAATWGLVNP